MKTWWGTFEMPKKGFLDKQIGSLWLAVKQSKDQWQIYYERDESWHDAPGEIHEKGVAQSPSPENLQERFVLPCPEAKVSLLPALADRPVITRPATPFYVPAGQTATIFVSTPLWVVIHVGSQEVRLTEVAIQRPSDTWFGPNTRQGEICYASKTSARMSIEELPKRAHRAITPVQISNESDSHLFLERINISVPFLDLYEAPNKQLWTQAVKMVRKEDADTASLEILDGPPGLLTEAILLSKARQEAEEKTIIRTISGFFA